MPDIGWKSFGPVDPGGEYLAMASALPLRRRCRMPQFLALTRSVVKQLAASPGLRGYALRAHFWAARFWTLSAWDDEASLVAFTQALPHSEIVERLRPHMGPTQFVTWRVAGMELPLTLDEGVRRLE